MSGELILKKRDSWQKRLLALLVTAVVTLAVVWPMVRVMARRTEGGPLSQFGLAIVVPLIYYLMLQLLTGKGSSEVVPWHIEGGLLMLGDTSIPLESIKMVHCWKQDQKWTVNIETTGKNQLLRACTEGEEKERSVQRLYELVDALGYRAQWKE